MLDNKLKMPNNTRSNGKMSLKLNSAYNNCFWIFDSAHKRIVHNIRFKYNKQ